MDTVNEIGPKELEELLMIDSNVKVIDVREEEETILGMIGSALHIPLQSIPLSIETLDKGKHYVLVCRSGVRSLTGSTYLVQQGFKASNMTGGMLEWQGEIVI